MSTDASFSEGTGHNPFPRRNFLRGLALTAAAGGAASALQIFSPLGAAASRGRTVVPVAGGNLRIGLVGWSPTTVMPGRVTTAAARALVSQVYEMLAAYDTEGKLEMRLAEEITSEAPDRWIVRLRKEATWHDGRPVTAADVMFSMRRIVAADSTLNGRQSVAFIDPEGMKALDDKTVEFTLLYPAMDFADALTSINQAIVPEDFDPEKPIGSGPFKLESYTDTQQAKYTRFDDYWLDDMPYFDELTMLAFADGASQINALVAGQIDVAPEINANQIPVIEGAGDRLKIFEYEASSPLTLQMNATMAPFDDVRVRQALRLAIDRQQVIDQVYSGHARLGNDLLSPYDPNYASDLPQRELDVDAAKALLADVGVDKVEAPLAFAMTTPVIGDFAQVVVQQAAAAGIELTIAQEDPGTYYENYANHTISISAWGGFNILPFTTLAKLAESPLNATHWENEQFLDLFAQARAEPDDAKRRDLMLEMQRVEYEEGAFVVPVYPTALGAYSSEVVGQLPYPNAFGGGSDFRYKEMSFQAEGD